MKLLVLVGVLVIFSLFCVCVGTAQQDDGPDNSSEYIWDGTWSSPNYTAYLKQDASGISGDYVPSDLNMLDPGFFEGNVSEDGKTYSGVWIETGSNTYTLSDDMMSFTIEGFSDPYGPMTAPANYTSNATRVGDILDPMNPWSGNWVSGKKSYNMTQQGASLTGVNQPLANVNDEAGVLEGTVSEDGKVYTGNWTEKGGFTFVMEDTGSSFNATIAKSLDKKAVIEHMIFTK